MASRKGRKPAAAAPLTLTEDEQTLLDALKTHGKPADAKTLLGHLEGWEEDDIVTHMNALAVKQYVDFITLPTKELAFRARTTEEATKASGMTDHERIVWALIKQAGNKGIWIKDIKIKSNLHTQIVTNVMKSLEKNSVIKGVKSVKNPTKKLYMLYEIEPSVELTGGAWYTGSEMDMDFIDRLSQQVLKHIAQLTTPRTNRTAIFSSSHTSYPTVKSIHTFIRKSGMTTVELSIADVQCLIDRLEFDGKIVKIFKAGGGWNSDRMDTDESEKDEDDEEEVRAESWMYRVARGFGMGEPLNAWTDVPCGRCPVFSFCSEDGPVNPANCVYYKKWLEF
ncbi:34-kDa subunit of RNA polymerase III (C) [Borealophlyctis nickersoniae]|nr:34-kDa subunit of RNA polymerase III (C) [Borealophlyctis nickersoniae]